jgi:hypothetical protein
MPVRTPVRTRARSDTGAPPAVAPARSEPVCAASAHTACVRPRSVWGKASPPPGPGAEAVVPPDPARPDTGHPSLGRPA